jgi:hypothetical protein
MTENRAMQILPLLAIVLILLVAIARVAIWNNPRPTFQEFLLWLACWASILLPMLWKVPPDRPIDGDGKMLHHLGNQAKGWLLLLEFSLVVVIPVAILLYFYLSTSYLKALLTTE